MKDITSDIHLHTPSVIFELAELFKQNNKQLLLVGGCVRDIIMNLTPKDFDVCTDATPDECTEILLQKFDSSEFEFMGEKFGVILFQKSIEIASFRSDEKIVGNNRHPLATFGVSIEKDSLRRDLTVNALSFDLINNILNDFVGGVSDIENKIIRTVGNASERFDEDNLRKCRTIRFASRFDFEVHKDTMDAMISDNSLNISRDRVLTELKGAFDNCGNFKKLTKNLIESTMINSVLDGISINTNLSFDRHTSLEVFLTDILRDNTIADISKNLVQRLKLDCHTVDTVKFLSTLKDKLTMDSPEIISLVRKRDALNVTETMILEVAKGCEIVKRFASFTPSVSGKDLIEKGFKQGIELSKELDRLAILELNS